MSIHHPVDVLPMLAAWKEKKKVRLTRNSQELWMRCFGVASFRASGVVDDLLSYATASACRSTSTPLWKTAPARTRATRWGALTARQRAWAESMSL